MDERAPTRTRSRARSVSDRSHPANAAGDHVDAILAPWPALQRVMRVPEIREPALFAGGCLIAYVLLTGLLIGLGGRFWLDLHLQSVVMHHRTAEEVRFFGGIVDHLSPDIAAAAAIAFGIGAAWGRHTWRPVVVTCGGVALIAISANLVRVVTGRGLTYLRDPGFERPGAGTYPSGHLSMALGAFLLTILVVAPGLDRRRYRSLLAAAVALWAVLSVSLTVIDTHWITDDVAAAFHVGVLIGGLAAVDAWWELRTHGSLRRPRVRGESPHRAVDARPALGVQHTH